MAQAAKSIPDAGLDPLGAVSLSARLEFSSTQHAATEIILAVGPSTLFFCRWRQEVHQKWQQQLQVDKLPLKLQVLDA